jgi:hypothetical protein
MSGPLADWTLKHAGPGLGVHARAVLARLALRADHDGSNANLAVDEIAADLEVSPTTVRAKLDLLQRRKLVKTVARGGTGRGDVTRRRIIIGWCADDAECRHCRNLAEQQERTRRGQQVTPSRAGLSTGVQEGVSRRPLPEKRGQPTNVRGQPTNVRGQRLTPLRNGDGPPSGGTVTHPESTAARAPDGAAVEPGMSEANRAALAAYHAEQRRAKAAQAVTSTIQPSGSVARPVSAAAADAQQAATDTAAKTPRRTANPSPATRPVPRPAVQADPAHELDPAHARRRQGQHKQRGRKGRRGREPPARCPRSHPPPRGAVMADTTGTLVNPNVADELTITIRLRFADEHTRDLLVGDDTLSDLAGRAVTLARPLTDQAGVDLIGCEIALPTFRPLPETD